MDLSNILSESVVFVICICIFAALLIFILLFLASQNSKSRKTLMKDLSETQRVLFERAAEMLADKLTEYTDKVLVERVDENYSKLISQELLPNVNYAADRIAELSEAVAKRQESGMAQLAEMMADQLAVKTSDYIRKEAVIVTALQDNTDAFAKELSNITQYTHELSDRYSTILVNADNVTAAVSGAMNSLNDKMVGLGNILDGTAHYMAESQTQILQNVAIVKTLIETTNKVQKIASDSALMLNSQNDKTAGLLAQAVGAMQQNTENAAKAVLFEFNTNLKTTTDLITGAVTSLKDISININNSASQFSKGLSGTYDEFGNNISNVLTGITDTLSESVSKENERIIASAENYAKGLTNSIFEFNSSLDGHITNLQTITQQLNNNVSSFKGDVDMSSSRFEIGMEKSVGAALEQMDISLAEIVKRLVSVTENIQEAADALPKAVKAISE